ncbi:MAG: type II toxin-antitoxin system RelE/ParE family toxin [Edaphobacter sp.]
MPLILSPQAEIDLDEIWFYIAKESTSIEVADRLIDTITNRLLLLATHPYLGRLREEDFGPGTRTFAVGEYVVLYTVSQNDALILRIVHGRRDLETLFSH